MQEDKNLGQPPAYAGMLLDDVPGLLHAAHGLRFKDLFQRVPMAVEFAVRFLDGDLADALQATFEVLRKGTLDRAAGAASQEGNRFVGEGVMLQPENLHAP